MIRLGAQVGSNEFGWVILYIYETSAAVSGRMSSTSTEPPRPCHLVHKDFFSLLLLHGLIYTKIAHSQEQEIKKQRNKQFNF